MLTVPVTIGHAAEIGSVTGNVVNVRNTYSLKGDVITQVKKNDVVTVYGASNGWYEIELSNGTKGWIYGKYINILEQPSRMAQGKRGIIKVSVVNLRTSNNKNADISGKLSGGDKVLVIGWKDGWYNVRLDSGKEGWVLDDFVRIEGDSASRGDVDRSAGAAIAEYAKTFLGARYVYGGSSPGGFDCSGLTYYIFEHFGIKLERTSDAQSKGGTCISRDQLMPGDLVFFNMRGGSSVDHTGIYIGDGNFIHSSTPQTGVIVSQLSGVYLKTYVTARRYW